MDLEQRERDLWVHRWIQLTSDERDAARVVGLVFALVGHFIMLSGAVWLALSVYLVSTLLLLLSLGSERDAITVLPNLSHIRLDPVLIAVAVCLALASHYEASTGHHWPEASLLWILAIIASVLSIGAQDFRFTQIGVLRRVVNWEMAAVALILGIAALLRFYRLDLYPNGLHGDEGVFGLVSWDLVRGHGPKFFELGTWNAPAASFYYYGLWQSVLGYGQVSLRMCDSLGGVLVVLATYALGRLMFGCRVGLIVAVLGCFCVSELHFSRIAIGIVYIPALWISSLFFLWWGLRNGRGLGLALSGICGGLSFYFVSSALAWLPVAGLIFVAAALITRSWLSLVKPAVGLFLAFGVTIAPLVHAYGGAWRHAASRLLISDPRFVADQFKTDSMMIAHLLNLEKNLLGVFVGIQGDQFYLNGLPMVIGLVGAFIVVGGFYALFHLADLRFCLLVIWLGGAFFVAAVATTGSPQGHRLIYSVPAMLMLAAIAIDRSLLGGWNARRRVVKAGVSAIIVILIATFALWNVRAFSIHGTKHIMWETAAVQASYLRQLSNSHYIALMAKPRIDLNHPTTRFLSPGMSGIDIDRIPEDLVQLKTVRKPIAFVAYPHRLGDLERAKELFPNGYKIDVVVPVPQPHVLFTVYTTEVPPPPPEFPPSDPWVQLLLGW